MNTALRKRYAVYHYELKTADGLAKTQGAKVAARFLFAHGWSAQTAVRVIHEARVSK